MRMFVLFLAFAAMFLGGVLALIYQVNLAGPVLGPAALTLAGLVGFVLWQELSAVTRRLDRLERGGRGPELRPSGRA
jgi:hypothetical protein